MGENFKEELLKQQKEQQKAEKEQQLSALPEMERVAILSHEEWIESEGAEGCKMDLRGKDLSKIKLTRFNFDKAELRKANLSGAKIYCGSFKEACLSNCNLEGAYMDAILTKANLNGVQGKNADFNSDECDYAYFIDAILQNANFTGATLCNADFTHADLSEADFEGADLDHANFTCTNLRNANLLGVRNLESVNLYGADISSAKISLKDISIKQLETCLFTPELAQIIQAKYNLMTIYDRCKDDE